MSHQKPSNLPLRLAKYSGIIVGTICLVNFVGRIVLWHWLFAFTDIRFTVNDPIADMHEELTADGIDHEVLGLRLEAPWAYIGDDHKIAASKMTDYVSTTRSGNKVILRATDGGRHMVYYPSSGEGLMCCDRGLLLTIPLIREDRDEYTLERAYLPETAD